MVMRYAICGCLVMRIVVLLVWCIMMYADIRGCIVMCMMYDDVCLMRITVLRCVLMCVWCIVMYGDVYGFVIVDDVVGCCIILHSDVW